MVSISDLHHVCCVLFHMQLLMLYELCFKQCTWLRSIHVSNSNKDKQFPILMNIQPTICSSPPLESGMFLRATADVKSAAWNVIMNVSHTHAEFTYSIYFKLCLCYKPN